MAQNLEVSDFELSATDVEAISRVDGGAARVTDVRRLRALEGPDPSLQELREAAVVAYVQGDASRGR
jgi:hypothetical protein